VFKPFLRQISLPLVVGLGVKDLRHEWRVSAALMLAIVSVLAPLLLLLGLKTGVVETMRDLLLRDPRNLEVIVFENTSLSRDWFAEMQANPEVAFVIPRTRTLNTIIELESRRHHFLDQVEVIPTGPGDPLLPPDSKPLSAPTEILLSHAAATHLAVSPGSVVKAGAASHRRQAASPYRGVNGGRHRARACLLAPGCFRDLEFS